MPPQVIFLLIFPPISHSEVPPRRKDPKPPCYLFRTGDNSKRNYGNPRKFSIKFKFKKIIFFPPFLNDDRNVEKGSVRHAREIFFLKSFLEK